MNAPLQDTEWFSPVPSPFITSPIHFSRISACSYVTPERLEIYGLCTSTMRMLRAVAALAPDQDV